VILALPLLQQLRKKYPEADIHFLVRKGNEILLKNHPALNRVWTWDKNHRKYVSLYQLIKKLRNYRFDSLFNLHRFSSSGLLMAMIKADQKICFDKNPFSFLASQKVNHRIPDSEQGKIIHEVQRNLSLLEGKIIAPVRPELYPGNDEYDAVKPYQASSPYLVIAPASVWATKQWPAEKWKSLLGRLPSKFNVYIIGSKADTAIAKLLLDAHPQISNLCGKLNLLQTAALLKKAVRVFSNDSAATHLASGVNSPVTTIYCSTIPQFGFGPLSDQNSLVETDTKLDCRPCGLHGYSSCPEKHFSCALHIKAMTVYSALDFYRDTAPFYTVSDYRHEALKFLQAGGVLLMDTDTVPGLTCAVNHPDAVEKIIEIKERKPDKGFIVLCSNVRMVQQYTRQIPDIAFKIWDLSESLAITLVFTASRHLNKTITGTNNSIAIRIPASASIRKLIETLGRPLISTSANISNHPAAKSMKDVNPDIKNKVDFILHDKNTPVFQKASSIIRIENKQLTIIREGEMNEPLRSFIKAHSSA